MIGVIKQASRTGEVEFRINAWVGCGRRRIDDYVGSTEIVRIMLRKLGEQVRAYHEHAADAKQTAEAAADLASKASFLDVERRNAAQGTEA